MGQEMQRDHSYEDKELMRGHDKSNESTQDKKPAYCGFSGW